MQTLAYNSNLHPAESVAELIQTLDHFSAAVRAGLAWDALGIDLRLGSQAVRDCQDAAVTKQLRDCLERNHLHAHTINAFPLSPFQSAVVKDQAYTPDWTSRQRLEDSIALIHIALAIHDGDFISMSTLPASYKPWAYNQAALRQCAQAYATWAAAAAQVFRDTGRCVHLAIEPEPWCFLENTHETIYFWQHYLLTDGLHTCAELLDNDLAAARTALQRHLGVCFDTCHVSLAFEDQAQAVARLRAANIPIHKVQFSAAPEIKNPQQQQAAVASLLAMHEPRFLHQSALRSAAGSVFKCVDLDGLAAALERMPTADCVRSHFHIPVFWPSQDAGLSSTIADSIAGLHACVAAGATQIAVETYTWSVLADDDKGAIAGTIHVLEFLADLLAK